MSSLQGPETLVKYYYGSVSAKQSSPNLSRKNSKINSSISNRHQSILNNTEEVMIVKSISTKAVITKLSEQENLQPYKPITNDSTSIFTS